MDCKDSLGLLKITLRYLARTPQEGTTSLESKRDLAWIRATAYAYYDSMDSDNMPLEEIERALGTLEGIFNIESYPVSDPQVHHEPYPKLRALQARIQQSDCNIQSASNSTISMSKRKQDNNAAMDELTRLESSDKRRRVITCEETYSGNGTNDSDVDFVVLMRKHSISLHQGLRSQWNCVCKNCSCLSVSVARMPMSKGFQRETNFDIFFGVRSQLNIMLQEAQITVQDRRDDEIMSTSALKGQVPHEFAHICNCIADSLNQRNCLHLAFESGTFKKLRPKPKNFGNFQVSQTVSLSTFFQHQQGLRGGKLVLPLQGRRILAFILARALLPFLETPWVQPSFNHSNIQFFRPMQDEELPYITKPFLDLEQVPVSMGNEIDQESGKTKTAALGHRVHPNASIFALGILLCELNDCTPVEIWQENTEIDQDINASYYTGIDKLKQLASDASEDYYLAAKACMKWEYFPAGEDPNFESPTVQRLFYQNVIKRLESVLVKSWNLQPEHLTSLDSKENERYWGPIGQQVLRQQTWTLQSSGNKGSLTNVLPAVSHLPSPSRHQPPPMVLQLPIQYQSPSVPTALDECSSLGSYLFDTMHHKVAKDTSSSERWMDSLLRSVDRFVDADKATTTIEPIRIAILDSGFDPQHPFLLDDDRKLYPRIKEALNFVNDTEPSNIQDEIGHGTHALGLLFKIATCAEIYIAKVASQEALGRQSYTAITKAINHAVTEWNVDIISMSFGIREYNEPMSNAVSLAIHENKLIFAAASNEGANFGRAFPAKHPGVFCIHSTDSNGDPSGFNPTQAEDDINFSLLGEQVCSHWPFGRNGHDDNVKVLSGTSVATPIAAGLAATLLSFVRQQEHDLPKDSNPLAPWLQRPENMQAVLNKMAELRKGYNYIAPHRLLRLNASKESVYNQIKDMRRQMYD